MSTKTAIQTIAYQSGNVSFNNRSIDFELDEKNNSIHAKVYKYYLNHRDEPCLNMTGFLSLDDSQIYFNRARFSLRSPEDNDEDIICVSDLKNKKNFFDIMNGLRVEDEGTLQGKFFITLISK